MKKTVYFRLEYYKDTDDLSYKYRNRLFINFLRKIKAEQKKECKKNGLLY